jgi:hypothetical protein
MSMIDVAFRTNRHGRPQGKATHRAGTAKREWLTDFRPEIDL